MPTCQKNLKIGDLAKLADLEVQTIRYYESLGLLPDPQRTESGYRTYDQNYLEHLKLIKNSQDLGFTLEEIKELVKLKFSSISKGKDVKELVEAKIEELDDQINELKDLKTKLAKLNKTCSGKMKTSCCPILNSLSN